MIHSPIDYSFITETRGSKEIQWTATERGDVSDLKVLLYSHGKKRWQKMASQLISRAAAQIESGQSPRSGKAGSVFLNLADRPVSALAKRAFFLVNASALILDFLAVTSPDFHSCISQLTIDKKDHADDCALRPTILAVARTRLHSIFIEENIFFIRLGREKPWTTITDRNSKN